MPKNIYFEMERVHCFLFHGVNTHLFQIIVHFGFMLSQTSVSLNKLEKILRMTKDKTKVNYDSEPRNQ